MKFAKPIILILLCLVIFGGGGYFAYRNLIQPAQPSAAEAEALKAPAAPKPPPDPAAPELAKVAALRKDKKNAEARELLEAIVANYPGSPRIDEARVALGEMNADVVLSTNPSRRQDRVCDQGGRFARQDRAPVQDEQRADHALE